MTLARRRALVCLCAAFAPALALARAAHAQTVPPPDRRAYVFLVPGVSFEELLSIPNVRAVARAGGAGLMSAQLGQANPAYAPGFARPPIVSVFRLPEPPAGPGRPRALRRIGDVVRTEVPSTPGLDVLVVIVSPTSSGQMIAAKDDLHPIVVAQISAERLFHVWRPVRGLTSDSTRRAGVVSDADIGPTVLGFLGRANSPDSVGSPIRVVDAPAPYELHARYLANRRMTVPVQAAAGIAVTVLGLFGVGLLRSRRAPPAWLLEGGAWLALTTPALATALLAAGHLPTLSYATVIRFVVGVTLIGTLAFAQLRRWGLAAPAAGIGLAVLAFFAVEAALHWTAALTPFLGGSELDGGRFYGLPNAFIGLLMAASLWVASRLRPAIGFGVVAATGLFAGLPGMGANLGASVTIFAAAGLWLAVRTQGRLGLREVAVAAGVTVAGTAAILVANRFLASTPTHITRFVEANGHSVSGILRTVGDRLLVGWRLLVRDPFGLIPVLGVPVTLAVVLRPSARVRAALDLYPEWHDVLVVTLLASLVAYVANDSGAAAVGQGFAAAVGGLLYVSLAVRAGKMNT